MTSSWRALLLLACARGFAPGPTTPVSRTILSADATSFATCGVCGASHELSASAPAARAPTVKCAVCNNEWHLAADALEPLAEGFELVDFPVAKAKTARESSRARRDDNIRRQPAVQVPRRRPRGRFRLAGFAVDKAFVLMDGDRSRGYGFVTVDNPERGATLIAHFDGTPINGRPLTVRCGTQNKPRGPGGARGGPGGGSGGRPQRPPMSRPPSARPASRAADGRDVLMTAAPEMAMSRPRERTSDIRRSASAPNHAAARPPVRAPRARVGSGAARGAFRRAPRTNANNSFSSGASEFSRPKRLSLIRRVERIRESRRPFGNVPPFDDVRLRAGRSGDGV